MVHFKPCLKSTLSEDEGSVAASLSVAVSFFPLSRPYCSLLNRHISDTHLGNDLNELISGGFIESIYDMLCHR